MSFVKLTASTLAIAAVSATAAMARDTIQIKGSSTVLPYAQIVAEAFGGLEHPEPYPCERVAPLNARREVLVDQDAASRLPKDEPDQA